MLTGPMKWIGFVVVGKEKWKKLMKMAEENFPKKGVNAYVGTNEAVEFDNFIAFKHSLDVIDINENEVKVLNDLFDGEYGFAHILDHVFDSCREETEETDVD